MRIRKGVGVAVVALALAVLAASCSSSNNNSSSSPGVTSNSVLLGTTQPLTGPAAPGYSEIAPATKAYFQYVNDQGGVYGRKLNLLILDDQYNPSTTTQKTQQLVLQDKIFVDLAPLGTPTVEAAIPFLNAQKVPTLFIESGCDCWSSPQYPYAFGWQPPYTVEGKILGQYVAQHFKGQKIGYLYQDDEFGIDGVKGLDYEIPKSAVVSRQTYVATPQALSAGLGNQIAALQQSGAQVVVLFTIPAATALALLAAAELGYHPQWVVTSVGSDPTTLTGLLSSFSKGKAGAELLNGLITLDYLPPTTDTSNPWVPYLKGILNKYEPGATWDGNTEYGVALGFTFVELLKAVGKNLTRASLIKTLETKGSSLCTPGLVPLTYSPSVHYGYQGAEVLEETNNGQSFQLLEGPQVTTISPSSPITPFNGTMCTPPSS